MPFLKDRGRRVYRTVDRPAFAIQAQLFETDGRIDRNIRWQVF